MDVEHTASFRTKFKNNSATPEELVQLANHYLAADELTNAYPVLARLTELLPDDGKVHLTAGLTAMALKKTDDALEHFQEAVTAVPDDFNANYNLALGYLQNEQPDEALERLMHLSKLYPNNATIHNDIAVVWSRKEEVDKVVASYERALSIDPNYTKARENAMAFVFEQGLYEEGRKLLHLNRQHDRLNEISITEIERWESKIGESDGTQPESLSIPTLAAIPEPRVELTGKKIVLFATYPTFINDTIEQLRRNNEVKLVDLNQASQMDSFLEWADIAWFEWCDNLLIEATKRPKRCPIICRLHSYEAFTDMPGQVDWSKVDLLVFVNDSVKQIFEQQVAIRPRMIVVHNGVDLDRFSIPNDKTYGKKIASVGYINYKKNPALLLYCFKKIHEYDPAYTLHIAGSHQDPRIKLYFDHFLAENPLPVVFDGWVEDMPAWYADKDFVISTSLFESFHYSIAEGMASGLMPLIHNWYGANQLYPNSYLYADPDQCLHLLMQLEKVDRPKLAFQNRRFIAERYDGNQRTNDLLDLISVTIGTNKKTPAQLIEG